MTCLAALETQRTLKRLRTKTALQKFSTPHLKWFYFTRRSMFSITKMTNRNTLSRIIYFPFPPSSCSPTSSHHFPARETFFSLRRDKYILIVPHRIKRNYKFAGTFSRIILRDVITTTKMLQ